MANIIYKCSGCGAEYDDEYRCFECIASCNTPVVDISRAELARALAQCMDSRCFAPPNGLAQSTSTTTRSVPNGGSYEP